ncbi:MAG: tRNA 2-thiouridine(34) synthase MnmA [Thermodesulfovibrionales bacterium]
MPKVIVGMSGGVDSSVAAHLLTQQGFDVEGVSFLIWEARCRTHATACCAEEAAESAGRTASALGISLRCVDVRIPFMERVIEPFAEAYARALTPNPCILCNRYVKFPYLLREADRSGAEFIATGHYARIEPQAGSSGVFLLKRGRDQKKDQSYVLAVLPQKTLARLLLPLGGMTKDETRELARSLHLPAAERPESQEICFVEDRDYAGFISRLNPGAGALGPIRDSAGNLLGTHTGLFRYTVGQRKGIGVSRPDPLFVIALDHAANTLYVGTREEAMVKQFSAGDMNWLLPAPSALFRAEVKVRSTMEQRPALVAVAGDGVNILFDSPQWAPSPGQTAVLYDGDTVIAAGTITAIARPEAATRPA